MLIQGHTLTYSLLANKQCDSIDRIVKISFRSDVLYFVVLVEIGDFPEMSSSNFHR